MSSATPQRLYLMQLSTTTIPLAAGQGLAMSSGCYLVQTSDGKNILIDSGLTADYTPPPGTPPSENEKNVLEHSPVLACTLTTSISSSVPISTSTMRAITMHLRRQNLSSSANTMNWRAAGIHASPPHALTGIILRCATGSLMATPSCCPASRC